ncbi:MAG TPA: glycosyltransferase, partial [Methylomirabilota bacterium]|nr:glycosyltransferase [Methylomirabilota bacterium]
AVQLVTVAPTAGLAGARAIGIRAATAPVVFIGETHTYPQPEWAAALLDAFEGPWATVVPAITNANPNGPVSWAAYVSDYGRWGEGRPQGEIPEALIYNAAYRRQVLLDLGDGLEAALDTYSEALWPALHRAGHRAYFAPGARIAHLNVGRLGPYVHEKLLAGFILGSLRAARWPWRRRLLYVLASPLIALVLAARLREPARRIGRLHPLPLATVPLIVAGAVLRAVGEAIAYAGAAPASADARMTEIELHKVAYASRRR